MELESLRWLIEVADGATVTETAARFHTSQPAVTRALHRLSVEFGAPLTERDGRRLRLTFAGEIAVAAARRALADIDGARNAIKEANDPATGTVRFGFLNTLGHDLVPDLLNGFRHLHPHVRFRLRQDGAERIMAALLDGQLDLLLSSMPASPSVSWEPLTEEELVVVTAEAHPLAGRITIRIKDLRNEPWVLLAPGYGLRQRVDELCDEAGFAPQVAFEGQDLTTLYALIATGNGIGLFPTGTTPDRAASNHGTPDRVRPRRNTSDHTTPQHIVQLRLNPRQSRAVGLITVPDRVHAPSVDAFAHHLRSTLSGR